jgi:hypothetical protein
MGLSRTVGKERPLNETSRKQRVRKIDILELIPFNIQGNKAALLSKSLGNLVIGGARASNRVIDAFAGTGLYIHFLRDAGLNIPMVLNEFDPYRYISHLQIKHNPAAVLIAAEYYVNQLKKMVEPFENGNVFGPDAKEARVEIRDFFQSEADKFIEPGQDFPSLFQQRGIVKLKNAPELAGLYIVMQNTRYGYRAIQADAVETGLTPIAGPHEMDMLSAVKGKIKLFSRGKKILFNLDARINAVHNRMKNVSVCNGDGWALIRDIAGKGDFVPVDTSYLGKGTSNYNQATREDCNPEIYMRKISDCILPAMKRGAKFLITNNWDDAIVAKLAMLGFTIKKVYRAKGVSHDNAEFAAINFRETAGAIYSRRKALGFSIAVRIQAQTDGSGREDACTASTRRVA